MHWFRNLKTSQKLALTFGLITLMFAVVVLVSAFGILKVQNYYRVSVRLSQFEANNNGQRASMLALLNVAGAPQTATLLDEVRSYSARSDALLESLPELVVATDGDINKISELKAIREKYKDVRDNQVIPLISSGQLEQAQAISTTNGDQYLEMRNIGAELSEAAQTRGRELVRHTLITCIAIGVVALGIAIFFAVLLTRLLAAPLRQMSATADQMAQGDLSTIGLTEASADEVGMLARSFARMARSLQALAFSAGKIAAGDLTVDVQPQSERDMLGTAFAAMVDNLRALTSEIASSANVLGTSTTQISASTTQFAASAAETAAAVSETSTTVEEVRQTAQVSRDKAKIVSDTAQRAAEISKSGLKATEDTLEGMQKIRSEMEAIGESLVRLSDQSQAIAQIVTTVEDLAAQSNLLAVNASIEAAKAGEYGKGFAVVAQEVKNLAEQSKTATGEVRLILTDIQKATAAAVMVTEKGNRAVEMGLQQANKAGSSIHALSASASDAAQAAMQISASSQQQLVGVDQVASAMESIKQASSQNAESARQLERAAYDLRDLGQNLKLLVEKYNI
jgi:methyl-accepting chemotaxis protein